MWSFLILFLGLPHPCPPSLRDTMLYEGLQFDALAVSRRTAPSLHRVLPWAGCCDVPWHWIWMVLHVVPSEAVVGPRSHLLCCKVGPLDRQDVIWDPCWKINYFVILWIMMLAQALQTGMGPANLWCKSMPVRMHHWLFEDRKDRPWQFTTRWLIGAVLGVCTVAVRLNICWLLLLNKPGGPC